MGWGIATVGRLQLSEQYTASENHNAGSKERTLNLSGQHYTGWKGIDSAGVQRIQEDVLGLADRIVPVTFEHKTDQNGYYRVHDVNVDVLNWSSEDIVSFRWSFILQKFGPDNTVDLESRIGTIVRTNSHALTGERWHAPSIGHYGYFTGAASPSGTITRIGQDGGIIVYRGIPSGINPRWGCAVSSYSAGRVRLLTGGFERTGTVIRANPTGWELNNGLVQVTPLSANGMLRVGTWGGTAFETKDWHIALGGATTSLGNFDSMAVSRNDFEMVTIRLIKSATLGRTLVDITLRRGSRFIEIFVQTNSATTLGAYLETIETATDNTATGYVVATNNDLAGNKFIVGSSQIVAYTANRGLSKAAVTSLDLYIGSVVDGSGAAAGDAATVLRDQYIGAVSESTMVVRR
jgi:hypothetical protein